MSIQIALLSSLTINGNALSAVGIIDVFHVLFIDASIVGCV